MAKITNMKQLREKVLQTFDDLESGKISLQDAAVIVKLSDTVINGLNCEMKYASMVGQTPSIPFYTPDDRKLIEATPLRKVK